MFIDWDKQLFLIGWLGAADTEVISNNQCVEPPKNKKTFLHKLLMIVQIKLSIDTQLFKSSKSKNKTKVNMDCTKIYHHNVQSLSNKVNKMNVLIKSELEDVHASMSKVSFIIALWLGMFIQLFF